MFASHIVSRFASRSAATATVRAVKRRTLIPTRAALTIVSCEKVDFANHLCILQPSLSLKIEESILFNPSNERDSNTL